ncbi:type II secretion system F family protein [Pseudomonas sp. IT-P176]|uniref:type II secretion system F family protein n=1 Tax=Pseudomonas sp. IT-P176 TaxID=3026444 RepID=UPI0039DF4720
MAVKAAKVSLYAWQGTDRTGRKMSGESSAQTPALIKAQLRQRGIIPGKVRKKFAPLFSAGQRVTAQDIALFTRQMATMLKAGVPLLQAFDIIAEGFDNPRMRGLLEDLRLDVMAGSSLTTALRKKPQHFDELYCNLIDAGEQAGALDTLLERVASYREKTQRLKARVRKAMTYPLAVLLVAVIVSAILLLKVVPQFEVMFQGFGAELPALTRGVIGLAEFLRHSGWLLLGGLLAAALGVHQTQRRSPRFRDWLQTRWLDLPVVGPLLRKSAVARYARTLSTTFAAGVPLLEALNSVAGATGNRVFKQAVLAIREDVCSGMQLHVAMRNSGVFPNLAIQMTAIGEESGALDDMLGNVASYYEDDVETLVDHLTSLLEPLIMAVLGVIVGGLVIAMYLPIFQLGTAI